MASKTQQFIYALRAKYEGKGEVAALSSDLKAMGDIKTFQKLQDDFAGTTAALTDAKTRTRELRKLMNAPGGEAFTTSYQKAADEVKKLSSNLLKQKSALDSGRQSMQQQGFAMGSLAEEYKVLDTRTKAHGSKIAAMKTLGVQSFASIEQKVQSLHDAYKVLENDPSISAKELRAAKVKMEADITSLTGKTGKLVSKVDLMKRGIAGIASLAAGGYGFGAMAVHAGTAAKELGNFARVAGTSVEEFSALSYAVESVGISQEKLADMSKDVKDKIGDFVETGGGEFKDFFENVAPLVGITADELIKMSGPDCLVAIKKAMDDANVSAESQVFYLEAIANDASLLTPLLQDNGRALKEKADRARELGIAVSDMDNAKLVEMATVTKELGATMNVLTREIVSAIAPALQVLMGHVQNAVAWFNQLSPGMQKFIVFAGAGTAAVLAMGVAFAPLISSITLGGPLFISIGAGIAKMASSAKLATIASRVLGVAMRGIPLIGIALAVYEIGKAFGIWTPILHAVQKGAVSLAAGVHLLGLKIRWLWNVLTGDDAEVAAIEKRMEEVDAMYGKMFAGIGKKQADQISDSKDSQKNITNEVKKGAVAQIAIAEDAAKKMAEAYATVDGVAGAKGQKKEEPDEFGITKSERESLDKEVEKLDESRLKDRGKGGGLSKNKDGVWVKDYTNTSKSDDEVNDILRQAEKGEPQSAASKQTKKDKTSSQEKPDEFAFTPSERKSMDNQYEALTSRSQSRIDSLQKYKPKASGSASDDPKPASRVVEIKFPSGSLHGDEDVAEKVVADLQRMGMMA